MTVNLVTDEEQNHATNVTDSFLEVYFPTDISFIL